MSAAAPSPSGGGPSKKDERRRIIGSPKYNRMGFKDEAEHVGDMMLEEFTSPLVKELKDSSNIITK
jgi:hypothetical protein